MTWLFETLDIFDIFWTLLYILLSIQNEAEKVVFLRHHRLFFLVLLRIHEPARGPGACLSQCIRKFYLVFSPRLFVLTSFNNAILLPPLPRSVPPPLMPSGVLSDVSRRCVECRFPTPMDSRCQEGPQGPLRALVDLGSCRPRRATEPLCPGGP